MDNLQETDLVAIRDETVEIARAAGRLLQDYFDRPHTMELKSAATDLVTEADRASEQLIVKRLQAAFPDHQIVGEEGGSYAHDATEASALRWYIDPIDGTTNFAHRIPHFAISMALNGLDGFPLVGVVHDPMRGECFAAARAQGAMLNGQQIKVSNTDMLARSVIASGFPYDKWTDTRNNTSEWANFVVRTRGIRRMGSAALDLAYVAAGRYDGYWEQKLSPWDFWAGLLLVQEAGGVVSDLKGRQDGLLSRGKVDMIASNSHLQTQMLAVIQQGPDAPLPAG
ncbi:MAG: inositol monophosphatase [Chloroflexi bacterium]|nr:inositol monophosphatase [Chloroflexota bacterium]